MNKRHPLAALSFLGTVLLLLVCGCEKTTGRLYVTYEPIYAPRASVLASINGNVTTPISAVGKIYVKDPYIFISDTGRGIHVIDNHNSLHPVQTAFLAIPGNNDIAIKGNILYADMQDELLTLDISNIHNVKLLNEQQGIFNYYGYENVAGKVIVGWKKTYTKYPVIYPGCAGCQMLYSASSSSGSSSTGVAGSMSRMALVGNNLYAIPERHSLQVIDIQNAAKPQLGKNVYAGFDLETVFPFKDKLFLGSMEGVYIYDLSNPADPKSIGSFSHGRACDPVITDGNYAYVTLHAGTMCGGASNELDVLNIQDLANPVLAKTFPMTKPTGLSKDGNLLFVCDSPGVKVYDASSPESLELRNTLDVGNAYDVITVNHRLVAISDRGVYQFDYAQPDMPLLSALLMSSVGK
ncbi:MAG TPA: hypothetical protein VHD83_04800 [Puia sp.]|nr:hypothetical protein [Puia sp.]